MMISVGNGAGLPGCLDPRSSYDKMRDPHGTISTMKRTIGLWGVEMERDVV